MDYPKSEHIFELLSNVCDQLEENYAGNIDQPSSGLQTGYLTLDKFSGGLKPGDLTLITGRSGGGQKILILNLLSRFSQTDNLSCLFISLHDWEKHVLLNLFCLKAGCNHEGLFRLSCAEKEEAFAKLKEVDIEFITMPNLSIKEVLQQIKSFRCWEEYTESKPSQKMIFIEDIHLMLDQLRVDSVSARRKMDTILGMLANEAKEQNAYIIASMTIHPPINISDDDISDDDKSYEDEINGQDFCRLLCRHAANTLLLHKPDNRSISPGETSTLSVNMLKQNWTGFFELNTKPGTLSLEESVPCD